MGRVTTMVGVLAAVVAVAGCGGSGGSGATEDGRTQVVLQAFADPEERKAYQTLIDAFEQRHEDIQIKLVTVADQGDHVTKLATDYAAGSPADIFLLNYRRFGQFAGKRQLEPLEQRLAASDVVQEKDLFPQALDGFRFGGALQCVPQNISSPVVYYNTRLFEEAGVPRPKPGWTWDDMREAGMKTRSDDVFGIIFEPNFNRLAPFIWEAGGEVVDDTERPTRVSLLEKPDREALEFLVDLRHKYGVFPALTESEAEGPEPTFIAGRAAMMIDSRRAVTTLRAAKNLEWDVAPFPVSPKVRKQTVMLHADAYCMAKSSKVKDAAFEFVEYAVGPEGAPVLARTGRTVPSLKSVADSEAFLDPSQPPANAEVWLDQIPNIKRFPNISTWNEIEKKADVVMEEWFFGAEPPEALGLEIDIATGDLFDEAGRPIEADEQP